MVEASLCDRLFEGVEGGLLLVVEVVEVAGRDVWVDDLGPRRLVSRRGQEEGHGCCRPLESSPSPSPRRASSHSRDAIGAPARAAGSNRLYASK